MKVVIVDHPKILGFLLRMYYHIPKVKEESLTKKAAGRSAAFFCIFVPYISYVMRVKRKIALSFLFVV